MTITRTIIGYELVAAFCGLGAYLLTHDQIWLLLVGTGLVCAALVAIAAEIDRRGR